jgi:hypothetical protein
LSGSSSLLDEGFWNWSFGPKSSVKQSLILLELPYVFNWSAAKIDT